MHDCGGIQVLKKTTENVQILQALKDEVSRFEKHDICYLCRKKNDGMSARNIIQDKNKINTTSSKIVFFS